MGVKSAYLLRGKVTSSENNRIFCHYRADMASFFILLLLICSLCVHSFHLKLQKFSKAPPIRNMLSERPRLLGRPNVDPHSICKMQASTTLSSLVQHSIDIKHSTTYWDLYGRVPYDDWLFTTSHLTNPDLLKRSFVEAVCSRKSLVNYKNPHLIYFICFGYR